MPWAGQSELQTAESIFLGIVPVEQEAENGAGVSYASECETRGGENNRRRWAIRQSLRGRKSTSGTRRCFSTTTVVGFRHKLRFRRRSRIETESRSAIVELGSEVSRAR